MYNDDYSQFDAELEDQNNPAEKITKSNDIDHRITEFINQYYLVYN